VIPSRAFAILLIGLVAFSGCAASPTLGPGVKPTKPSSPDLKFDAPGATIERLADGALITWKGTVSLSDGQSALDPRWPVPRSWETLKEFPVKVPQGITSVEGWLNWTVGGSLLFFVLDEHGHPRCGAMSGRSMKEECVATIHPAPAADLGWRMRISADATKPAPRPIPYELSLRLRAVDLPIYGPPAPFGDQAPLRFAKPVALGLGDEPSIAITKSGTVYVSARVFKTQGLWSSGDGEHFSTVNTGELPYCELADRRPPITFGSGEGASHFGCGDTDVATSGDDHVYFTSHWGAEAVAASHDGGRTWFSNPYGTGPNAHTDRQWIATDGPNTAYLAYIDVPSSAAGTSVAKTIDGGHTWATIAHAAGNTCALPESLAVGADSTLYMAGCTREGPAVGVSSDGGLTWQWRLAAKTAKAGALAFWNLDTVTVDRGGNLHMAWILPAEQGSDVFVASSKDKGLTWTTPTKVNHAPGTYVFAWVTSGEAGRVAVGYFGTKAFGSPDHLIGDWYAMLGVTQDSFAASPQWAEATVSDKLVQYGPVCIGGNSCAHARNLGDFFQIQAGPDGNVALAYPDGSNGGGDSLTELVVSATTTYARQIGGPNLGAGSIDKSGGK
jgi:hypothetical protein